MLGQGLKPGQGRVQKRGPVRLRRRFREQGPLRNQDLALYQGPGPKRDLAGDQGPLLERDLMPAQGPAPGQGRQAATVAAGPPVRAAKGKGRARGGKKDKTSSATETQRKPKAFLQG